MGKFLKYFTQKSFNFWERFGLHVTLDDYESPIPDTKTLPKSLWDEARDLVGIDLKEKNQIELLNEFRKYQKEYAFATDETMTPLQFYLNNGAFGSVDAEVAYCMVRQLQPRTIFEVGGGYSTLLLADAISANQTQSGSPTRLVTIDPYPGAVLKQAASAGLTELVEKKVEDVGTAPFSQLSEGDILFIDSSHVVRTGGDVNYLFLEALPRLKRGVLVHIHDIFLPAEYPKRWIFESRRFFSEQYLLQAFLTYNSAFEVIWAGAYMHLSNPEAVKSVFPSYDNKRIFPGSFWIRKKI